MAGEEQDIGSEEYPTISETEIELSNLKSQLINRKSLVDQLRTKIKFLEEQLNEKEQEIFSLQGQLEKFQFFEKSNSLPTLLVPEEQKQKLDNFLQNYLFLMKKEVGSCQLVINHEAATEKEREHFLAEKRLLEYKIEQVQSFVNKK